MGGPRQVSRGRAAFRCRFGYTSKAMEIRNIAIIAHVDHGKTTLVDKMLRQAGAFRDNQVVMERVMDSNPLERERGITILAKNTSIRWQGTKINIVDTPGSLRLRRRSRAHPAHGGWRAPRRRRVRRTDAADAIRAAQGARARPHADRRHQQDRPPRRRSDARSRRGARSVHRARGRRSAARRAGRLRIGARGHRDDGSRRRRRRISSPLFEAIVEHVPPPPSDASGPFQMLISTIDYSPYLGRLGDRPHRARNREGRRARRAARRCDRDPQADRSRVTKLFALRRARAHRGRERRGG